MTDNLLSTCGLKEITNNNIKNSIISLIYQEINVSNFRYQILENNTIDLIKKDTYYITPHIVGSNCWIIYCQINSIKYQVILYKKDLKPIKNQINVQSIKIYEFKYNNLDKDIIKLYPLTVFDGKFIMINEDAINKYIFLIQDMYCYDNQKMITKKLPDKVKVIEGLLQSLNTGLDKSFIIKLSGIYTFDQIGDLIFNKIKQSKLKINGLIFLPEKSGKILLYINDNDFNMLRNNIPSESICKNYASLSVPSIPLQMSIEKQLDKHLISTFVLRKTNIPDVFEIYKYENEKIYLNLKKENYIGICHIPDIKTSHYCKMMGDTHNIFVNKCNYNYKFKKWTVMID